MAEKLFAPPSQSTPHRLVGKMVRTHMQAQGLPSCRKGISGTCEISVSPCSSCSIACAVRVQCQEAQGYTEIAVGRPEVVPVALYWAPSSSSYACLWAFSLHSDCVSLWAGERVCLLTSWSGMTEIWRAVYEV